MTDEFDDGRIECYDEWSRKKDHGGKFRWKYPKRFLQYYLPQNDKDIIVFFQFGDSNHTARDEKYLERVIWAIEDDDGYSNFKRFFTSYYPGNFIELLECVKERKL